MRFCPNCSIGLDKQGDTCATCKGHGCHPDDIQPVEEYSPKEAPFLTSREAYALLAECWPYNPTYAGLGKAPI